MKNKKKGFTLVELLVVIAILAVLATVTTVAYVSFVDKAKLSNDLALTTQMNNVLLTENATEGANKTPHEAVLDLKEAGYDVTKLTPTSEGYEYVWDSKLDKFFLLDKGTVVAPNDLSLSANHVDVFKIVGKNDTLSTEFSNYLKDDFEATGELLVSTGLDAGSNTNVKNIKLESQTLTDATVRTNGGTLTINAPLASINHYGEADKVNVDAVAPNSYHVFAKVPSIEIKVGRIDITATAEVKNVLVTGNTVKVDTVKEEVKVSVAETVTTKPTISGTTNVIENVKTIKTEQELKDAVKVANNNVVLGADITCLGHIDINVNDLTLDLNGYTLTFNKKPIKVTESNGVVKDSFDVDSINVTSKNILITGSGVINCEVWGLMVNNGGELTIDSVSIIAEEAALYCQRASKLTINSGTYTAYNNYVVGTNGSAGRGNDVVTINGGTFNGYIKATNYIACGVYVANNDTVTIDNAVFNIKNGTGIVARCGNTTIGKNVVINLENDGTVPSGKVGDSMIQINSNTYIVRDELSKYPGGVATVINNSNYNIIELIAKA